jgi:hypothetical protein
MRAHRLDPAGDDWSQLMRRAPAKSRKHLKDAALIAIDDRMRAKNLVRYLPDLLRDGRRVGSENQASTDQASVVG